MNINIDPGELSIFTAAVAHLFRSARTMVRSYLLAGLLAVTGLLCGCSRVVMPTNQPGDANRFFVCRKCGCLSMLLDAHPPSVISAHAKSCGAHAWKEVSRGSYVWRASRVGMRSMPQPSSDLDFATPFGQIRFLLYPGAFVFLSGAGNYMISASDPRIGGLAALVILILLAGFVARRKRHAQPAAGGNAE